MLRSMLESHKRGADLHELDPLTECEQHALHHDHCQICAEACRRCERALLASMPQ